MFFRLFIWKSLCGSPPPPRGGTQNYTNVSFAPPPPSARRKNAKCKIKNAKLLLLCHCGLPLLLCKSEKQISAFAGTVEPKRQKKVAGITRNLN
jgi:hypothetical protein